MKLAGSRILVGEKAPFLITVLFGAAGWVITHTVDRIIHAPTIVWQTKIEPKGDRNRFSASLRNITRDQLFTDLTFTAVLPNESDSRFLNAWFVRQEPAWEGDKKPDKQIHSVTFEIPRLQPGWSLTILAEFTGRKEPKLSLTGSSRPVRLVKPTLETFFAEHEFKIIWGVLFVYLLALSCVLRRSVHRTGGVAAARQSSAQPASATSEEAGRQ